MTEIKTEIEGENAQIVCKLCAQTDNGDHWPFNQSEKIDGKPIDILAEK